MFRANLGSPQQGRHCRGSCSETVGCPGCVRRIQFRRRCFAGSILASRVCCDEAIPPPGENPGHKLKHRSGNAPVFFQSNCGGRRSGYILTIGFMTSSSIDPIDLPIIRRYWLNSSSEHNDLISDKTWSCSAPCFKTKSRIFFAASCDMARPFNGSGVTISRLGVCRRPPSPLRGEGGSHGANAKCEPGEGSECTSYTDPSPAALRASTSP